MFRVDMRLRPFGDSGPLVASLAALEDYLQQHGRDWERYAWIKARAITGAAAYGERFARVRAAVRLPALPRLRRVRVAARNEGADRARGRAPRARRQHQARPGRHPRDRVHRAGVPAGARRAATGGCRRASLLQALPLLAGGKLLPAAVVSELRRATCSCGAWRTACRCAPIARPTSCRASRWSASAWRWRWARPAGTACPRRSRRAARAGGGALPRHRVRGRRRRRGRMLRAAPPPPGNASLGRRGARGARSRRSATPSPGRPRACSRTSPIRRRCGASTRPDGGDSRRCCRCWSARRRRSAATP